MKVTLSVTRFHIRDTRNALVVFYAIVVCLSLFAASFMLRDTEGSQLGGIDLASAIFIFVTGLNSFTTGFRFMQANNVSRTKFYSGTLIALTGLAGFMALVDTIYGTFLSSLIHYESMLTQIYHVDSPMVLFLWSFGLYTFMAHAGWMITMLYYRSNKLLRMLISLSPVIFLFVIATLDRWANGALSRTLANLFFAAFGFGGDTPNPYTAVLSFLLAAVGLAVISNLLVRRSTLRSQE